MAHRTFSTDATRNSPDSDRPFACGPPGVGRGPESSHDMRERRIRRVRTAAVALLATSALLSGCGVLPGGSGGSTGPLVVMTWAPVDTKSTNMPGMLAMAQAFEKYTNEQGGLNGRKL